MEWYCLSTICLNELKRSLHYPLSNIICGLREDLASAATASQVKYVIS